MLDFLLVPTILFLIFVAPLWIIMHYRSVKHSSQRLAGQDLETVEQMLATLDQMSERIEALESILDHDNPNWRQQSRAGNDTTTETR